MLGGPSPSPYVRYATSHTDGLDCSLAHNANTIISHYWYLLACLLSSRLVFEFPTRLGLALGTVPFTPSTLHRVCLSRILQTVCCYGSLV